jgi:quercetin 2,3-dioxygenase
MHLVRRSEERGHADHGWLDSYHTFSFSEYYDPEFMGFSALRVINEDRIAAGTGFGMHPHRDMEIITYVVEGELEHRDSMGNSTKIKPGEVQRMSAGTGIRHSERNSNETGMTHLYQIWILPEREGIEPSYGQKSFADELNKGGLALVVSRDGRNGSLTMNQDAEMYIGRLAKSAKDELRLAKGRKAWVQVVKGAIEVNGELLKASDAAAFAEEEVLKFKAESDSELIVFNLP